jgi:hypothetical protein
MIARMNDHHMAEDDGAAPLPPGLYLIANKRTMRGTGGATGPGELPGYLYWEPPSEPADSGWRVFVGDETQDEADDPDNFQINAVETLTRHHPALQQVIAVGVTGAWAWDERTTRYVAD